MNATAKEEEVNSAEQVEEDKHFMPRLRKAFAAPKLPLLCAEGGDEEAERQLRGPRYLYTPPVFKDVVVLVFVSHPILSCRLLSIVCDSAGPWL